MEYIGLVNKTLLKRNMIGKAYDLYKKRKQTDNKKYLEHLDSFRKNNTYPHHVPIKFLGVFDIVGAVGIEGEGTKSRDWRHTLKELENEAESAVEYMVSGGTKSHSHHINHCPGNVEHAFHAVSIDEDREGFKPTLLDNGGKQCENLTEVWFPGVHSDVGGGFKDHRLSNHAVRVMGKHMADHGIEFYDNYFYSGRLDDTDTPYVFNSNDGWPDMVKGHRKIPSNATLDPLVSELLLNRPDYLTYCNPNLKNVDIADQNIKEASMKCKGKKKK